VITRFWIDQTTGKLRMQTAPEHMATVDTPQEAADLLSSDPRCVVYMEAENHQNHMLTRLLRDKGIIKTYKPTPTPPIVPLAPPGME